MDARELTRDEKKKIRSLVTGMCANYDRETGLCLPLDCACYMLHKCWTGAYCRYFREAVPAPRPGASCGADRGRQLPGASGLCGLRAGIFTRRPSSLLFRRLQGRRKPPEKPGTYEENAEEKAGRRLRFAAPKGLIFRAFLRAFPGVGILQPIPPRFTSLDFVTYHTSGHVGPRYRKEVSLGDRARLCHFENNHF